MIVDCICGKHAVDVVHSGDHSREVGYFLCFVMFFFPRTTREEERSVFEYLLFVNSLIALK